MCLTHLFGAGLFVKHDNVRVIRAANPICRRMTERCKVINPEYSIFRDQPIARASPLRINTLLCADYFANIVQITIVNAIWESIVTHVHPERVNIWISVKENSVRYSFPESKLDILNVLILDRFAFVFCSKFQKVIYPWNGLWRYQIWEPTFLAMAFLKVRLVIVVKKFVRMLVFLAVI